MSSVQEALLECYIMSATRRWRVEFGNLVGMPGGLLYYTGSHIFYDFSFGSKRQMLV